jgi:hypothetical protein
MPVTVVLTQVHCSSRRAVENPHVVGVDPARPAPPLQVAGRAIGSAGYEMVIVRDRFALSFFGDAESFTLKVTLNVPFTVGFPLITPDGERLNPLGSGVVALTLHLYGEVPPAALSVAE